MAFTIEEQLCSDMDIFFPCNGLFRLHVATAGGVLPEKLMNLDKILNYNAKQFRSYKQQFEYIINPNLDEIKFFKSSFHRQLYIEDFVDKARKGFVSFDKSDINDPYDKLFHVVAYPKPTSEIFFFHPKFDLREIQFSETIYQNIIDSNNTFGKINLFSNI
ncbi:hypothetical protein K6T82_06935 [Flavobacterium sp. 17A]|uniref:Uncharacterized protein n=1 Tax=Flavobacterium potami TaxID=2872310 RepID=A0A9X1KPL1_9FLAO|nr:hypothetical protein [Flavobacterium potami]MBZ4034494.1 hypothetical protein [Flavobacterium potami]